MSAEKVQLGKFMNARLRPPLSPGLKTSRWAIYSNSGGHLGEIFWYTGWRQYVLAPYGDAVFSVGCMTDIQDFIAAINKQESRP